MHRSYKVRTEVQPSALLPSQVAEAYNFPKVAPGAIAHRSVAILELGGAFNLSDVASYCKKMGYAMPVISTYFTDGAAEAQSDADGEVCLDIDVILAAAQGCHVKVVFAPNSDQGFIDGMKKCLELNPDSVSISWGSSEDSWDKASIAALDTIFNQCGQRGIAVFAASGDNGSSDGSTFGNHCDYPASSPYVIACGGTRLELNADGTRATEVAWSVTGKTIGNVNVGSTEGGGGGISDISGRPSWQNAVVHGVAGGRMVPDISGNADPATGYQVDIDGTITQIGGTSAVAPLYAALQVLLNAVAGEHVGNMHTRLYSLYASDPKTFYDVTEGNNGKYKASVGFDQVTGLGVVNGAELAEHVLDPLIALVTPDHNLMISLLDHAFQILHPDWFYSIEKAADNLPHAVYLAKFLNDPKDESLKATPKEAEWYKITIQAAKFACKVFTNICPVIETLPD